MDINLANCDHFPNRHVYQVIMLYTWNYYNVKITMLFVNYIKNTCQLVSPKVSYILCGFFSRLNKTFIFLNCTMT